MSTNYEAVPCFACGAEPLQSYEDGHELLCPNGCMVAFGPTEDKAILAWNAEQEALGKDVPL